MSSYRKYKVIKRVEENNLVVSIYLAPIDGVPLSPFMPGQHLMFKLHIPGQEVPVFRYYSFSDIYNQDYYRMSVKKELPPMNDFALPGGLVSSYFYDHLKEGDILEAKGPLGDFYLNPADKKPVALVAGGIGITPLLSMMKSIAKSNPGRMVYFFYGVSGSNDHSFQLELQEIRATYDNICITTFYKNVGFKDIQGVHYDYEGYINIKTILQIANDIHLDYYVCGPGAMMTYIIGELEKLGVDKNNIHKESFNSINDQSLEEETHDPVSNLGVSEIDTEFSIEFLRSGKRIQWDNRFRSILEFAEANDIEISSGCLFGDCGTCLTEIKKGFVQYMHQTMVKVDHNNCLPCSCVPTSDLILNV